MQCHCHCNAVTEEPTINIVKTLVKMWMRVTYLHFDKNLQAQKVELPSHKTYTHCTVKSRERCNCHQKKCKHTSLFVRSICITIKHFLCLNFSDYLFNNMSGVSCTCYITYGNSKLFSTFPGSFVTCSFLLEQKELKSRHKKQTSQHIQGTKK